MIRFKDGPAVHAELDLQRIPVLLRVVINHKGEVDALDMAEDRAKPQENIFAYRLESGGRFQGFIDYVKGGRRCGGRLYSDAVYALSPIQPPDPVMRHNEAWAKWCVDNGVSLLESASEEVKARVAQQMERNDEPHNRRSN